MDESVDLQKVRGARRLTYMILTFPFVVIAAVFAVRQFHFGWAGVVVMGLVVMALTILLIRALQAKAQALGCASPAMLRYNRRMIVGGIAYMALFFFAVFAFKHWHVRGPLLWGLALTAALPVLGMIWAMARLLIEESDEYLRARMVHQALCGTGVLLVLATVWGFLEQFALVPHVPAWAAIPIFAIGLGVSQLFRGGRV